MLSANRLVSDFQKWRAAVYPATPRTWSRLAAMASGELRAAAEAATTRRMSDEKRDDKDGGLDLLGLGKLAEAFPDEAKNKVVATVCDTFTKLVSPATAATTTVAALVEIARGEFLGFADYRKAHWADIVARTEAKLLEDGKKTEHLPKPRIVLDVMESGSKEFDAEMRQRWANLLAEELTTGSVHPAVPRALAQLTAIEAQLLKQLYEQSRAGEEQQASFYKKGALAPPIHYDVLAGAGLIHLHLNSMWMLNAIGAALLKAVGELPTKSPENRSVE